MSRTARLIDVKRPYHICQRGNSRQIIFHDDKDKEYYLKLLSELALKYEMKILAYCLMENHVHLIVIPQNTKSLSRSFRGVNGTYSFYFNKKYGKSGHVWGDRYFSKVLDSQHLAVAVRYVERNPARAGLVMKVEEWRWSSARAHLKQENNIIITDDFFKYTEISPKQWKEYLSRIEYSSELAEIRKGK